MPAVSLVRGELELDFDPSVFGPVSAVDVFSSTGDQMGTADIRDRHVDVNFLSVTGGLGRLPELPLVAVTVPVLSSAAPGSPGPVALKPGADAWVDEQNVQWSPGAMTGSVEVGGNIAIAGVSPGGGLLPANTELRISGTGFTPDTTVRIAGAVTGKAHFVSPGEIDLTLLGAGELTGRLVTATGEDGSVATFVSAFHGNKVSPPLTGDLSTIQPIFPLQLYPAASVFLSSSTAGAIALRNPGPQPVDVALKGLAGFTNGTQVTGVQITLAPGSDFIAPLSLLGGGIRSRYYVVPSKPIQLAGIITASLAGGISPIPVPVLEPYAITKTGGHKLSTSFPLVWDWKISNTPPAPQKLQVLLTDFPASFSATAQSEGGWLSVTSQTGTTCNALNSAGSYSCPEAAEITVSADGSKLRPGTYRGTVTISTSAFGGVPAIVPVVLNVSADSLLVTDPNLLEYPIDFGVQLPTSGTQMFPVPLRSNADPTPFSAEVTTQSGNKWLTVSPASGVTPATLTIKADPAALMLPGDTGVVTLKGGASALPIQVLLRTATAQSLDFAFQPASLSFVAGKSEAPPPAQNLSFNVAIATSPFTVESRTDAGGKWLVATVGTGPGVPRVLVSVDQSGLAPGTYRGSVKVTSAFTGTSGEVPVTLLVWGTAPPIVLNPTALNFSTTVGSGAGQTVQISTGDVPLLFDVSGAGPGNLRGLVVSLRFTSSGFLQIPTPSVFDVSVDAGMLEPGIYTAQIIVTAPPKSDNTAILPVTLTVQPRPDPPSVAGTLPLASMVVNSASQVVGSVSPGEILSIFGQNIGPAAPAAFGIGPDGRIPTQLGEERVLFDGVPAPVLYSSSGLVNVIVPYEVGGRDSTTVEIANAGNTVAAGTFPVSGAAPGVFALDATGRGPGAVLNQDNTTNSAANPALRGSIIQIYATGEGLLSPAGANGEITDAHLKRPVLPVRVTIGGVDAVVLYAGTVPTAVAGLMQLNVVVPGGIAAGAAVPVVVTVGQSSSSEAVTISVR